MGLTSALVAASAVLLLDGVGAVGASRAAGEKTDADPADAGASPGADAPLIEVRDRLKGLEDRLDRLVERSAARDELDLWENAVRLGVVRALVQGRTGLSPHQEQRLAVAILREAGAHGLDPLLVTALIRVESGFDPFAVSRAGALGLMQVMPATGEWLSRRAGEPLPGPRHLFDFERNLALGCAYLAMLLKEMGNLERALVAYNRGPAGARRLLGAVRSRDEADAGDPYARAVTREYQRLRAQGVPARSAGNSGSKAQRPVSER
jgi:soluble lytic murein transglycosylase